MDDLKERLRKLRAFLAGREPLDGLHFGEGKPRLGYNARFWWRSSHLPVIDEAGSFFG